MRLIYETRNEENIQNSSQRRFAALSVALMALVSIIPNLELALPAISGLFVAVIVIEVDKKWALGVWAAVSLLSLIVVPNKAAAIIYAVFFGYYPVLKSVLESKTPRASSIL